MSNDTILAEGINLSQPGATVLLPASDLAAILTEVRGLREITREHEMRLDKQGGYIRELQFKEKPEPQPAQRDKGKILVSLLATHRGKMPALEARQIMHMSKQSFSNLLDTLPSIESLPMKTDKRRRLLVLK